VDWITDDRLANFAIDLTSYDNLRT